MAKFMIAFFLPHSGQLFPLVLLQSLFSKRFHKLDMVLSCQYSGYASKMAGRQTNADQDGKSDITECWDGVFYDALFIDTAHEFSFVGFETDAEKELFLRDMDAAVAELTAKVDGRYPIINDIHLAFPKDADNK